MIAIINNFWNHTDERTRKMNRNVVYSVGVRVAGIFVSLLLVPFTLDYLNAYEYGIWVTLNSILTWINYFDIGLGNGLRNKLGEAIASNDHGLGKIYVSTTFCLLIFIVVCLCCIMLVVNTFLDWNSLLNAKMQIANLNRIVNIVLICVCISFVMRTVGIIYMAYQRTWVSSLLTFLGTFLSLLWIIYLKIYCEPSLLKVAVAFSMSPFIVYLIAYPITFYVQYKEIRPSVSHIKMKYSKELGGLGVKFFILQIACLLIFATSNFLVSNIFSPAEVTPYSIANRYFNVVALGLTLLLNPLWSAITDAYARKDYGWIQVNIRKMMRLWMICSMGLLLMVAVSPIVYRLWVGGNVNIPYGLSLSVAVYNIIFLWANIYSTYCNGVGHLNSALWSMSAAAVLFIPLCFLFTRLIGINAVAYTMGLVLLIPSVVLYCQYKKDILCVPA